MKKNAAALVGTLALLALAVVGAVYYALRPRYAVHASGSGLSLGKKCSPEKLNAQVQEALKLAQESGAQGGQAGPKGAAAGAGAGLVTGMANIVSGPCGPEIEKKLKLLLSSADAKIRNAAKNALGGIDRARLKAASAPGKTVTRAVKGGKRSAKAAAKRVGVKL